MNYISRIDQRTTEQEIGFFFTSSAEAVKATFKEISEEPLHALAIAVFEDEGGAILKEGGV
jgi:hypothetical protein